MHIRRNATIAAAIVLGAVAVLVVGSGVNRSVLSARQTASVPAAISSAGRSALAHCRENVTIIHDVHWAAACMSNAKQEEAKRTECLREEAPSGAAATTSPCGITVDPPDDSPECTLPDSRALVLNAARSAAENRCIDEANAVERTAGGAR